MVPAKWMPGKVALSHQSVWTGSRLCPVTATPSEGRSRRGVWNPVAATTASIEQLVTQADLVIGAVLIPGAAAPKLVTREMVRTMKRGSVLVDISIDQGGCFETSRPTTHAEPTYEVDGVVHYCVTNMPGAVPRTST